MITDFSSYNTDLTPQGRQHPRFAARPWFQPHWVGDLTLSCRVTVREPRGRLRLELIKAGLSNRCEIDLATGRATLFHDGAATGRAREHLVEERGNLRSRAGQRGRPADAHGRRHLAVRRGPGL